MSLIDIPWSFIINSAKDIADIGTDLLSTAEVALSPTSVVLEDFENSIQLDDYSCGAQSAYSILRYWKKTRSIKSVTKALGTSCEGTTQTAILNLFRKSDLSVSVRKNARLSDIYDAIYNYEAPMLIYFLDDNDEEDVGHWAVVYGYSEDNIFVMDPSFIKFRKAFPYLGNSWSKGRFKKEWTKWGAIVYES